MSFQPSDIRIPCGTKQAITIGMIGRLPVELLRAEDGVLQICSTHANFDVFDETPKGVVQALDQLVKWLERWHPELLNLSKKR